VNDVSHNNLQYSQSPGSCDVLDLVQREGYNLEVLKTLMLRFASFDSRVCDLFGTKEPM
jgi:hypothetical protein